MDICTGLSTTECVLEYNNLVTFKLAVLALLLLFSFWLLYKNNSKGFWDLKSQKSAFENYVDGFKYMFAKMYIFSSPFLLVLLRNNITFGMFLTLLAVGYAIFFILFVGGVIIFTQGFVSNIFNRENGMKFAEKMKYAKSK